jgi:hypothetical protein
MAQKKDFSLIGEPDFWSRFFSKFLFTLISVKVWGLIASIGVSTYLLLLHNANVPYHIGDNVFERGINGAQWVTFNTTIWALIFGMKEIFKISESRDDTDMETMAQQNESKKQIASIISAGKTNQGTVSQFTPDGKEIVSEEPDGEF